MTALRSGAGVRPRLPGLALAVAALVASVLVGIVPNATTPPAAAVVAEDEAGGREPTVRIVIDRMTPAIPEPGDTLRITGRVISTSRAAITDLAVQIRRSSTTITDRRAITAIAEAPFDPPGGEPADVPLPGTRVVVAEELPPGARRAFTLRLPVDSLGLSAAGTYLLGVDAYGKQDGVETLDTRQGTIRTFVPWFPPDSQVTPVDLVWLWPLADWPARSPANVLLTDQTPVELSPDGRLDRLLDLGARHAATVSWVADPALLQTASVMSRGYQVQQDGAVVVGDREAEARRWLERLTQVTRSSGLRTLPYADVDASALTRGGQANDVVRAVTQGPGIAAMALGRPVEGDLYWAPFGRIDRPALNVLASSGVSTVILSADAMPPTDEAASTDGLATAALPTSVGSIRAVLTDPGLTDVLALPQRSASDVILARQRFLAETAVAAVALPADAASRVLVAAPDTVRWTATPGLVSPLLRATRGAPWLSPLPLARLLDDPAPSVSRQRGGYGERARDAELPPAYVARIARTSADLEVFASVLDDPTGVVQPFAESLLRAGSAAWRTEPEVGEAQLGSTSRALANETARVRILSEGQITLSGDTGAVPITIANDLDRSVTVGLTLRGLPAVRLSAEPVTGIRIEPGRFASVEVDARVVGGDPLPVDVQLLSPEGEDYGEPARITVASTAYARAASWVVAAAFVAIAVFVVVGVTRRIRAAHRARGTGAEGA